MILHFYGKCLTVNHGNIFNCMIVKWYGIKNGGRVKIKKHLNFTSLRKKASEIFKSIPDWRQLSKITISLHDAMMSGFACMYFSKAYGRRTAQKQSQYTLWCRKHSERNTNARNYR